MQRLASYRRIYENILLVTADRRVKIYEISKGYVDKN